MDGQWAGFGRKAGPGAGARMPKKHYTTDVNRDLRRNEEERRKEDYTAGAETGAQRSRRRGQGMGDGKCGAESELEAEVLQEAPIGRSAFPGG